MSRKLKKLISIMLLMNLLNCMVILIAFASINKVCYASAYSTIDKVSRMDNSRVTNVHKDNIEKLKRDGLGIIKDQSFWIMLKNWGKVKFISGEKLIDGKVRLYCYLIDKRGIVLYKFSDFKENDGPMFYKIRAIAFKDVNNDNLKDIIVIAEYVTGVGETGRIPFPVCKIYIQKEKKFIVLDRLDDKINSSLNNQSIEMIMNYIKFNSL